MTTPKLPARVQTSASSDTLFQSLAAVHATGRPELPDRIVRAIAAAHELHALDAAAGAIHRAAGDRNVLRELVEGLKSAATAARPVTLDDAAGVLEHQTRIADLRARLDVTATAAREAARDALAVCHPAALAPLLLDAMDAILDEAAEPADVMAGATAFRWDDPAALLRAPEAVQRAFHALVPLAEHRDRILAAVVALTRERRDWRPDDFPGIGEVPPRGWSVIETGHPVQRLVGAVSARNAAEAAADAA